MKNLKIFISLSHLKKELQDSQQFTLGTSHFNNSLFNRKGCSFSYRNGDIFAINPVEGNITLILSLKDSYDVSNFPVSMFFNTIFNTLNVALSKGEVISIHLNNDLLPSEGEAECVGCISNGLQAAALSPDGESVIFLDGDNKLILMSGNFDPIDEIDLLGSDQGEQDMVNVGWGKKETQFHGSEGKDAAKKKISEEEAIENIGSVECQIKPQISWRGDSTLFAVSYWCPSKKYQKVKIFNKAGLLQCTSELLPGLEAVISWRPSGNLIALAQKLPNKHVICFMEKNGLRHGDFTLPPHIKVEQLSWNSESTILSAVCEDESTRQPCVLMFTTANYHWYLKQRLDLCSPVVALRWDDVIGNLYHLLLRDGSYLVCQWAWCVDHSAADSDDDLATVAVIDGCDLKLTPFKKSIIPPPMCAATVTLPSPGLQVMFPPSHTSSNIGPNTLCVYLSCGQLGFITEVESSPRVERVVVLEWKCPQPHLPSPSCLSHWLWLDKNQLIFVLCQDDSSLLCLVQVDDQTAGVLSTVPLEEPVLTVSHGTGLSEAFIQLKSGALVQFQDGRLTPLPSLPEPCLSVRVVGSHTFARTLNGHMYVDGELVSSNVTSYFCLPHFLVMTLSSHQLSITSPDTGFKIENEGEDTTSRRLERGSSLVIVVGHSVVLQMPRGNLETVEPRSLTLVTAGRLLDTGNYKAVAQLLRRQRIDLNLCVDHNPSQFLLSVPRFVAQVRDPQWLSVFLAELNERDVTRNMYAGHYKQKNRGPPLTDKVNRVCTALREAMTQTPEDREVFLQPILSTYVRCGRVGEAIALADSDQALNYLTLLMDTDRLYEEALGAYNLEKALKIAGKSLKDPKEYVAYLNQLREMEPAYMRFTVDKRLRKPHSALRNLAQCQPECEHEFLRYVDETGLYTLAMELFLDQPDMYRKVCLVYGDHLVSQHQYREAGLMIGRGGDLAEALTSMGKAGCWRQCLVLAERLGLDDMAKQEIYAALYSSLRAADYHSEAGLMCCELEWWERAVGCFVDARDWDQATYLCHKHGLRTFLESAVRPALLEFQSRTLADVRAKREALDKYTARLLVVRERKKNTGANFDAMSDIQSETSSLSSFSTSSAGTRTTRNTRKAQRKLWSLKEGNPREEQALLFTITELIRATERLTGEVHLTCMALAEFNLDTEAQILQTVMATALDYLENIRRTVWPTFAVKKTGSDAGAVDPTSIDMQLNIPPASSVFSSWKMRIYQS